MVCHKINAWWIPVSCLLIRKIWSPSHCLHFSLGMSFLVCARPGTQFSWVLTAKFPCWRHTCHPTLPQTVGLQVCYKPPSVCPKGIWSQRFSNPDLETKLCSNFYCKITIGKVYGTFVHINTQVHVHPHTQTHTHAQSPLWCSPQPFLPNCKVSLRDTSLTQAQGLGSTVEKASSWCVELSPGGCVPFPLKPARHVWEVWLGAQWEFLGFSSMCCMELRCRKKVEMLVSHPVHPQFPLREIPQEWSWEQRGFC